MNVLFFVLAICDPVCENGGICTAPDTCVCLAGYSGDQCENGMFFLHDQHAHASYIPLY